MLVHYSMNNLPEINSPVVTVGSFDGVHAGHRVIIRRLNDLAAEVKGSSVLITFSPHPRLVLHPETSGKDLKLISSLDEKIMLLEEAGLDHLIIMEFTLDFARTTSEKFVEHYLVGLLHAHTIVVGFNHYFGHNRAGSYKSLYAVRERFSFQVEEIPEQEIQNETVSSTRIRKALKEGNIQRANAYLEHYFLISTRLEPLTEQWAEPKHTCYRIPVDDPLKLLPPAGNYAASFSLGDRKKPEQKKKALVHLGEKGLLLYPLDPEAVPGTAKQIIQFHLRLSGPGDPDLSLLFKAIRELIY